MTRLGRGAVMLVIGSIALRLAWTGEYASFLQSRMRIPLLLGAGFVVLLGIIDFAREVAAPDDDERSLEAGPSVGLLLAIPVVVLMSVAPAALDVNAADRVDAYRPPPGAAADVDFDAVPDDGPIEMGMIDFVNTALYSPEELEGREVILEGMFADDPDVVDGFLLIRFVVSCCAADGLPVKVALYGSDASFEKSQWVRATVTWRAPDAPYNTPEGPMFIEADVIDIEPIADPPDSPYESPF